MAVAPGRGAYRLCPDFQLCRMRRTVVPCLLTGLSALVGMVLFSYLGGWDLPEAIYFSVCALMASGFGDDISSTSASRVAAIAITAFVLGVAASFIALQQLNLRASRKAQEGKETRLLEREGQLWQHQSALEDQGQIPDTNRVC